MKNQEKIDSLKKKASEIKKEIDYYNALQLALKLVLNGSYGAIATSYFILYNNHVAGTITAQGRDLTRTMDKVNEDYWYNQWHLDHELHYKLGIKDITQINKSEPVNITFTFYKFSNKLIPFFNHNLYIKIK